MYLSQVAMLFLRVLGVFLVIVSLNTVLAEDYYDDQEIDEDFDDDQDLLCDDVDCDETDCPELNCEFGVVPDVCECCYTCAKGPGESCGGMFDLAGICWVGSICQPHPKYPQLPGVCVKI
ncbi:IGFBP N-terminal domain-containing protein [Caerostris darwini]|uniref:IGFBP N-terminal domain-containing protein n=1 Tax=Caerostris darwini TaxID=1538125 RepID=A0AAV4N9J2_9ARAC|nr:IGFBP N-terminal domain-containing protein [Caerostris darwini]